MTATSTMPSTLGDDVATRVPRPGRRVFPRRGIAVWTRALNCWSMSDIERDPEPPTFADLDIDDRVLKALSDVGYESPSPIQAATIPPLLAGNDVVGLAQTGTGKTAAFALPILMRLDVSAREPRALVLAPTRELAIQVAEAFGRYAT